MRIRAAARSALSSLFHATRGFLERKVVGTRLQEFIWAYRHIYKGRDWADAQLGTVDHPHRAQIAGAISALCPAAHTLLEVGASAGQNLIMLKGNIPGLRYYGIDINKRLVEAGSRAIAKSGIQGIELRHGRINELPYSDRSMDIVLSDAVLMFIAPDRIKASLAEMLRCARKAVVLNEFHRVDAGTGGIYEGGRWLYDFESFFRELAPGARITISKSAFTGSSQWDEYGSLIIVELRG